MPVLDEVAARLVAAGVGTLGTTIFISSRASIPAGDGPYMTLIETGGVAVGGFRGEGGRIQNKNSVATQHPTVQISCRGASYQLTRAMCKAAYDALDGTWNTLVGGTFYQQITARQEPTDVGLDEAGRVVVVFNIDTTKNPS